MSKSEKVWHVIQCPAQAKANCAYIEENKKLLDAARYLTSFIPPWAKETAPGYDPTYYGTLTHEGDLKVIEKVKEIKKLLDK